MPTRHNVIYNLIFQYFVDYNISSKHVILTNIRGKRRSNVGRKDDCFMYCIFLEIIKNFQN